ncbi:hypothetical protein BDF14DRAFT_1998232 [Spinellus fusiger]|nr:hypothetical protein BDF14DRAFT_1998232 [Spinellus fusiger]
MDMEAETLLQQNNDNDNDTLDRQVDEFMGYVRTVAMDTLLSSFLTSCCITSEKDSPTHSSSANDSPHASTPASMHELLSYINNTSQKQRLHALQQLVLLSLVHVKEKASNAIHRQDTPIQSTHVDEATALSTVFRALQHTLARLHSTETSKDTALLGSMKEEFDLCLTLFYLMMGLYCDHKRSTRETLMELGCLEFLWSEIPRLNQHLLGSSLIKKFVLVLWKIMLVSFGGFEDIKTTKQKTRKRLGLELKPFDHSKELTYMMHISFNITIIDTRIKCHLLEWYTWTEAMKIKYPAYHSLPLPYASPHSESREETQDIFQALGTHPMHLPFQSLFPPKPVPENNMANNPPKLQCSPTSSPSFKDSQCPDSIREAEGIYMEGLYFSLYEYHILCERKEAMEYWKTLKSTESTQSIHENNTFKPTHGNKKSSLQETLEKSIETLYTSMVPQLKSTVTVLLQWLLSTLLTTAGGEMDSPTREQADTVRDMEILAKTISSLLLFLLKAFKLSHALKYEYLSQLLVDSGAILLLIRLLYLQDIASLVATNTDMDNYSVFSSVYSVQKNTYSDAKEGGYTNKRIVLWTYRLLHILHMLSKRKTARIILLVQYKSVSVFRRLFRIKHPMIERYTLKLIQSQASYIGRGWRSKNMKLISAIHRQCFSSANNDWLLTRDIAEDINTATPCISIYALLPIIIITIIIIIEAQEIHLRALIQYHHSSSLKSQGCLSEDSSQKLFPSACTYIPHCCLNTSMSIKESLHTPAYSIADSMETMKHGLTMPACSTTSTREVPVSCPAHAVSSFLLTTEINKLYHSPIEHKIKAKASAMALEGWGDPGPGASAYTFKKPSHRIFGIGDSHYDSSDSEEEEQDDKNNPLKNINWESLTEQDLEDRIARVGQSSHSRMSVDIDDPRYMKVILDVENNDIEVFDNDEWDWGCSTETTGEGTQQDTTEEYESTTWETFEGHRATDDYSW